MKQLIEQWRKDAAQPVPDSPMGQAAFGYVQRTLETCADQLEQAWHEYDHDAAWVDDCKLCEAEREAREHAGTRGCAWCTGMPAKRGCLCLSRCSYPLCCAGTASMAEIRIDGGIRQVSLDPG